MNNCSYSVLPGLSPGHTTVSQNRQSHRSMGCRGCLRQRSPRQVKRGLHVVCINRGHMWQAKGSSLPQRVCRTRVCTSHSWSQLCNHGSPRRLRPLSSDHGCPSWATDRPLSGQSSTPLPCRGSYTLKTHTHLVVHAMALWRHTDGSEFKEKNKQKKAKTFSEGEETYVMIWQSANVRPAQWKCNKSRS